MRSKEEFFIGVDIGTTGCRVSVFDGTGGLHSTATAEYPLSIPQPGWAEQDPELIFSTFQSTLTQALDRFSGEPKAIRVLAFSSVFHSLIPVSPTGEILNPMLIWADSRAQTQIEKIPKEMDLRGLYERTGCPLHPMYPFAKLLWFKEERPEIFAAAEKFISIKEYIVHRLTGKYVVDRSIASGTGCFNMADGTWDEEALRFIGLANGKLSEIKPTTYIVPGWSSERLGLPQGVSLVLGAGDGVLSTLGAGAIEAGQYTAMIGTSGAVRLPSAKPLTDWETKNWCYALTDDLWVIGGAISNGGLALRWARDKFARTEQYVAEKLGLDTYDVLARYAEQKPPGSDGLILLPFFAGERSPHYNANARGVLFGLNLNHGLRHLMRATFEGILYSMYDVFCSLQKVSTAPPGSAIEVRASGSFTRSPFWIQMMADVFGHPITLPGDPEGAVFGAAVMGMLGVGAIGTLSEIKEMTGKPKAIYLPDKKNHVLYRRLFSIYERVYRNLLTEFDAISKLQNELAEKLD
jgi:gluconokinase